MNAQISTLGEIPAASGEDGDESRTGFGYGILSTGPSNMIVVATDLGLEKEEETTAESGLATKYRGDRILIVVLFQPILSTMNSCV